MAVDTFPSRNANYLVCTSGSRPPGRAGLQIYETDTRRLLVFDGTLSRWLPPWNQPWGQLKSATDPGTSFDATTPVQVTVTGVEMLAGRVYSVVFDMTARVSANDTLVNFRLQWNGGGGWADLKDFRGTYPLTTAANASETFNFRYEIDSASGTYSLRFNTSRLTATVSTTVPTSANIAVRDMGPIGGPY